MSGRWGAAWSAFWQPDRHWVNEVNTTNLRTINGVRMFVVLTVIWAMAFLWASWHGVPHCEGEWAGVREGTNGVGACVGAAFATQSADFAMSLLNSYSLLIAAVMAISVGAFGWKRQTDERLVKAKSAGKAAGAAQALALAEVAQDARSTKERAALSGAQVVLTGDQPTVEVKPGDVEPKPEPKEWADGDPRGGVV